jgi:hypothetical protein
MIRPQRARIISTTAHLAMKNGPLTLVSTISRHVSGDISQKRVGCVRNESLTYFMPRPALFTRMSRRPNRVTAASTTSSQSLALVTSASTGTTVPGALFSADSRATASISLRSRAAVAITWIPARANPSTGDPDNDRLDARRISPDESASHLESVNR